MLGPSGFIDRHGEVYEIRRGGAVSRAKGLPDGKGQNRHVSFHPGTSVEAGDVLVGTV
jgi:hypothetical protein